MRVLAPLLALGFVWVMLLVGGSFPELSSDTPAMRFNPAAHLDNSRLANR